jgi:cell division protein FtsA
MSVVQLHGKASGRAPLAPKGAVVAALDLGSTKISCLIAEVQPPKHRSPDGQDHNGLRILGFGHHLSRGVRGGAIVNVDEAERAIRVAVDAAERMAQRSISEVYVNVSGGRPQSRLFSSRIKTQTGQVSPRDLETVLNEALTQVDPGRRAVLHLAPVHYQLDEARGVKDPLGMYGEEIGLDLGVVTVEPSHLNNLALAISRAHLATSGFVMAPYAAARSVLADDELALGVTLIDMGGATTSFAIFHEGHLVHADVIPVGGQHITNDIARGLSTTIAHAERMKTLWGSALASQIDEREMIAVPLLGERGVDTVQKVPKSMLTGIIRPRVEEIFELLRDKLETCGGAHLAGKRAVLTGGASQLNGVREVASQWLDRLVRMGLPAPVAGMPEAAYAPGFAVCAGLLNYALRPDTHYALPQEKARAIETAQLSYVRKMGRWIAESF